MYTKFLLDTFAKYSFGGLAQLARALRWQRRGDRFESDILHNTIFSPFIDLKGLFYAQKWMKSR